jgi:Peptidase family M28/PA domain
MAFLADDLLEGRETGTRGFDIAAQYVAAQFQEIGLSAINGTYLQPFAIRRAHVDEGATSLVVTRDGRRETLQYGQDFVTYGDAFNSTVAVAGSLVAVGDGVTLQAKGVDAYAGRDTAGSVVVALPGAPDALTPSERAYFESAKAKAANAAQHGASALLLVAEEHIPWDLRVRAARQLGSSRSLPDRQPRGIPVVYISRTVAAKLLNGQLSPTSDGPTSPTLGAVSLQIRSEAREVRSANVFAVLKGDDQRLASEYVVITAHLDHVGIGSPVQGDAIYNGAIDNASGVAGLLLVARAFRTLPTPPGRSILFVATTGEEQGELGAEYLVRHPPAPLDHLVAAINIDGLSFTSFTEADALGGANSSLGQLAQRAADQYGIRLRNQPAGVGGSDHAPFVMAGIPVLWIGAALRDDWMRTRYHTPKDDMSQPLEFQPAADYSKLVFTVAYLTAQAPERPVWNPGEFFQGIRK